VYFWACIKSSEVAIINKSSCGQNREERVVRFRRNCSGWCFGAPSSGQKLRRPRGKDPPKRCGWPPSWAPSWALWTTPRAAAVRRGAQNDDNPLRRHEAPWARNGLSTGAAPSPPYRKYGRRWLYVTLFLTPSVLRRTLERPKFPSGKRFMEPE